MPARGGSSGSGSSSVPAVIGVEGVGGAGEPARAVEPGEGVMLPGQVVGGAAQRPGPGLGWSVVERECQAPGWAEQVAPGPRVVGPAADDDDPAIGQRLDDARGQRCVGHGRSVRCRIRLAGVWCTSAVGGEAEMLVDGAAMPLGMAVVVLDDHDGGPVAGVVEGVPDVEFGALDVDAEQVDLADAPLLQKVVQATALDEDLPVVGAVPAQA